MLEFEELCENYEKLKKNPEGLTVDEQQKTIFTAILNKMDPEKRAKIKQTMQQRQSHFNDIVENPQNLVP